MKIKKIKTIDYHYGEEEKIQKVLYQSKEPILIKIKNFTTTFSLDYFAQHVQAKTAYDTFENGRWVSHHVDDFSTALSEIKKNCPYRIFGQLLTKQQSAKIEEHVPLWQTIPFRPRFFKPSLKVAYFFGGQGALSAMHFDREHCCILHLCLSGKKQLLLFTEDQSEALYKIPFVGDSFIDFSQPFDALCAQYPRLNQAEGYEVLLETGDMLFMPKNCWHYTRYLDAASSASYVFYPKKILQIYGMFTGYFFLAYKAATGWYIYNWPIFQKFSRVYAFSTGRVKYCYKIIEAISYAVLLPIISIPFMISFLLKSRKIY